MSKIQKVTQKISNHLLLTPVDGFSTPFNPDCDESEISFDFGGLKGIMEDIDREDCSNADCEDVDGISTKSCSPLGQILLMDEKNKIKSKFYPNSFEGFNLPLQQMHNVQEKPKTQESAHFTKAHPVNFNFFNSKAALQPVRRKKIKISQILKKKWTTKLPSFVENQKAKLISKINLINFQKINKYRIEHEKKMPMGYFEEKIPNRRSKLYFYFLGTQPSPSTKGLDRECLMKNPNGCSNYLNYSNKFNIVDNSDLNAIMHLNNRQNFNEFNGYKYNGANNFHLKSFPVNNGNAINDQYHYDYSSIDLSLENYFALKMQNCTYHP